MIYINLWKIEIKMLIKDDFYYNKYQKISIMIVKYDNLKFLESLYQLNNLKFENF